MRVLHVITGLRAGGAEQQLASLLAHTRHHAEVVTMYAPGMVAAQLRDRGVRVHDLGRPRQADVRALGDLVRLMRHGRYDVVHTHLYRACLYGRIAARLAGVGVIVATEHSLGETRIEGRRTTTPVRLLYLAGERAGHHTIAVSDVTRARLVAWGVADDRISVIPNGVDPRRFVFDPAARRRTRAELGVGDRDVVIGSVGRLHAGKRLDVLLEAAAPLLAGGDARLVLVGDGEQSAALRDRARRLGIADRVAFVGERSDVVALLSAMDVYAAPSAEETFGLAVVEALCAGLPAVVDACPAIDGLALSSVWRAHDVADLRTGLYAARVEHRHGRDRTAPSALVARLDITNVVAHIDDLYQHVGQVRLSRVP